MKTIKYVRASTCIPSTVILLFFHQKEDLVITSPKILVVRERERETERDRETERELDDAIVFKMSAKSDKASFNSVAFWLREI